MALDTKDIEIMERLFSKWSDEISTGVSRDFERVHERLDDTETRIYMRIADVEDHIDILK